MISMFIHAVYYVNASSRGCSGIQEVSEMNWKSVSIDNRSISNEVKDQGGIQEQETMGLGPGPDVQQIDGQAVM